jgi:hypothetical protein
MAAVCKCDRHKYTRQIDMSRVDRSERISGIRMVIMFRGISKIGSKYSVVCEYPKNDFVAVGNPKLAICVATKFNMSEYHSILEKEHMREFDTLVFSASIKHSMYGTVDASDIEVIECIRNSPVD